MRVDRFLMASSCLALLISGCQGDKNHDTVEPATGGIAFQLDFDALAAGTTAAPAPVITAVRTSVSRVGHATIEKELTVVNNVASGQIDNLEPGYWHVQVDGYEDTTRTYTGATDINVIAGAIVQCNILLEAIAPDQGSISITVGINPMPGYSVINQGVSEVLFDPTYRKLYLLDRPAKIIGIYDANTLVRTRDLALTSMPLSVALDSAGTAIYLGYPSGHIRRLDIASGQETLVSDVVMEVHGMAMLNAQFLMARGPATSSTELKVVNLGDGQIVSTRPVSYALTDLVYNPLARTAYSQQDVSPTDIHYVKVDDVTGTILSDGDSVYVGEYSLGVPLRIIKDGTRLATSSGNIFTSWVLAADDLRYSGSLGHSYFDLSADDILGKLFLLTSEDGVQKLLVIDEQSYLLQLIVELPGTPLRVFNTADSIVVLSMSNEKVYAKAFAKVALGL